MKWGTRRDAAFVVYRAASRFLLLAPYFYYFATSVRGLRPSEFGLVTAVYYVATVLLEVPSGILADRFGRKLLLIGGVCANALGFGVLLVAHDLWTFILAEAMLAVGTAAVSGADSALLFDRLASEGREQDYPRIEGAAHGAWLLSTAIGLPLADWFLVRDGDPSPAIAVAIVAQFVAIALACTFWEPPNRRAGTREITAGALSNVIHVPGVARWIALGIGSFVMIRSGIVLVYNPWLTEVGVPLSRWGTLLAVINLAGGLAAWISHRAVGDGKAERWMFAIPAALLGMYLGLASFQVPAAALLFIIQGLSLGMHPVVVRTVLNERIRDPAHRATVLSIESLACRLAFGAVALVFGALIEWTDLDTAITVTVALGLLPVLGSRLLPAGASRADLGADSR